MPPTRRRSFPMPSPLGRSSREDATTLPAPATSLTARFGPFCRTRGIGAGPFKSRTSAAGQSPAPISAFGVSSETWWQAAHSVTGPTAWRLLWRCGRGGLQSQGQRGCCGVAAVRSRQRSRIRGRRRQDLGWNPAVTAHRAPCLARRGLLESPPEWLRKPRPPPGANLPCHFAGGEL